ncbi:hypothetical protein [Nocardia cyriacigeorgica]|uniref:hypothetical protein n=1 Tax=Nocardia cyriacigeorgica TaxID=135487 RepID=UPI0024575D3F|nr:hypothetical protein [Nocardia cyriacigeorgica]
MGLKSNYTGVVPAADGWDCSSVGRVSVGRGRTREARPTVAPGTARESRPPPPLAAAGAGPRYFIDLFGNGVDLRARFQEALEVVIESMSTPEWVERFRRDGWRAGARLEELGLAL